MILVIRPRVLMRASMKAASISDYRELARRRVPRFLFDYLEAPQVYLKGTRMAFPGIKDAQDRADLIAYAARLAEEFAFVFEGENGGVRVGSWADFYRQDPVILLADEDSGDDSSSFKAAASG